MTSPANGTVSAVVDSRPDERGGASADLASSRFSTVRLLLAFLRRDALVDASYRTAWAFRTAATVLTCCSLYFLGKAFGDSSPHLAALGTDYFSFALLGITLSTVTGAALSGASRRIREFQLLGTLEPLFASPAPPLATIPMFAAYPLLASTLQAAILLGTGVLALGASFHWSGVSLALLAIVLTILAHLALGMISSALVLVFHRGDPIAWLVASTTYLFSGVIYPVDVLPAPLRSLSLLLPATHGLKAVRDALATGADSRPFSWEPLLALAAFSAVLWPVALLAMKAALNHARREGSLPQA